MNQPAPGRWLAPAFAADEPVLGSHALLPGRNSPVFGQRDEWAFAEVLRRPANLSAAGWKLKFSGFADPWNLRARELSMIALNPRHSRVMAAGIPAPRRPSDPRTVILMLTALRALIGWAADRGMPADLAAWRDHHLHAHIAALKEQLAADTVLTHVKTVRELHRCSPLLTGGGLDRDPWVGMSSRAAAGVTWTKVSREISTPAIPPQVWFPLIRAAWTYIDRFGPDILRAEHVYQQLQDQAVRVKANAAARLHAWLARPDNLVPLHHAHEPARAGDAGTVHWSLLSLQIGIHRDMKLFAVGPKSQLRSMVQTAVDRGQCRTAGLLCEYAQVQRADGSIGDWHPGLEPRSLHREIQALRVACYIFVSGLSMMRDSEVHEITKGAVVEYFGAPAVVSAEVKGREDFPQKHWWIIEPVARALAMAEAVSPHAERLFTGLRSRDGSDETFHAAERITTFVKHINTTSGFTGLDSIPPDRVAPHMFRRTMAMLTDQFPGSEIALGIQLKHAAARALANRTTQGYAANAASWAEHLEGAVESARFRGLNELFNTHKAGEPIGFGAGAERLARTFDAIRDTATAHGGDATVEHALLKNARISIRFGTLNNCLFDASDPLGAVCLENAVIPPGHTGPLPERCRPDRCGNSMIGPQHVEIWDSEDRALAQLLQSPRLAAGHRAALERQRAEAQAVLRKATQ
ncbi:integrase [Streptomyces sp. NPDC002587]